MKRFWEAKKDDIIKNEIWWGIYMYIVMIMKYNGCLYSISVQVPHFNILDQFVEPLRKWSRKLCEVTNKLIDTSNFGWLRCMKE